MNQQVPHIVDSPSPNHDARPAGTAVDILLLHYTGMQSAAAALERLRDPAAEVSAHWLVEEDGTVHRLVDEARRAWHAGRASWAGATDINARSVGIEIVNPGHEFGYRRFPVPQMASVAALAGAILARHPIPPARVLGHSDVAPDRKEDPGELFDWAALAAAGIGIWPAIAPPPPGYAPPPLAELQAALAGIGYAVETHGRMDAATRAVILAFQRRWLPAGLTGARDPATAWRALQIRAALSENP